MPTNAERVELAAGRVRPRLVLAGAAGVYVAFGLLVASTAALVPLIQADLGLGDTEMGAVLGAWQLVYIGASIPAGRVVDGVGIRRALVVSMTLMLLSGLGRAASGGFPSLFAAVALLGAGAPLISAGAPAVAASLFEGAERRRAVAVYSTAPALGTVLGLVLPGSVIGPLVDDDWRAILVVVTALAAIALLGWLAASRHLDDVMVPGSGPGLGEYRRIAGTPVVRFVLVLSIVTFFYVHGIGQWLVAILNDAGWSTSDAGLLAALGSAGGLLASFWLPRLATPGRRPALMIGALLTGALAVQLLQSTSLLVLVPAILATTAARAALVPVYVLTLMDHDDVGPERIAAATGVFFTTAQIGGVTGPAVIGLLSDLSGGFRAPLVLLSAVMLTVAAAIAVGYRRAVSPAHPARRGPPPATTN